MKKIIILTEASTVIGSGHVMRCLTIAKRLKEAECQVNFLMKDIPGNLVNYVQSQGFDVIDDFEKAHLYIIDHYEVESTLEKKIRVFSNYIMVIDDLANREHDCDILLDSNVYPNYKSRYDHLTPEKCIRLLGPEYLILRDEFLIPMRTRDFKKVENVLVFMGGTDPTNETLKVLKALNNVEFNKVNIVVGIGNENKNTIREICQNKGYHYHEQVSYMAKLMNDADFAIGAGGITIWERCYMGLPSTCTIVAENQTKGAPYADKLGACINLGWHEQITSETYLNVLKNINQLELEKISNKGLEITRKGQPNKWLNHILELIN